MSPPGIVLQGVQLLRVCVLHNACVCTRLHTLIRIYVQRGHNITHGLIHGICIITTN